MESLTRDLNGWGVPENRVHFETFGPSSVKQVGSATRPPMSLAKTGSVNFKRSGKVVDWNGACANLLELAEQHGVAISSGCRAGNCGTCVVAVQGGEISAYAGPRFAAGPRYLPDVPRDPQGRHRDRRLARPIANRPLLIRCLLARLAPRDRHNGRNALVYIGVRSRPGAHADSHRRSPLPYRDAAPACAFVLDCLDGSSGPLRVAEGNQYLVENHLIKDLKASLREPLERSAEPARSCARQVLRFPCAQASAAQPKPRLPGRVSRAPG